MEQEIPDYHREHRSILPAKTDPNCSSTVPANASLKSRTNPNHLIPIVVGYNVYGI